MFLKRIFNFIPKNEFSKALDIFNRGHYKKALLKFEEILAKNKTNKNMDIATVELYACEAHVALSKESIEKGNVDKAIDEMERAVSLKPHFADLRFSLGSMYFEKGDMTHAIEHFTVAIEINAKYFKARIILARAHLRNNQQELSAEVLSAGEESCPNFYAESFNDLLHAVRNRGQDEITERLFHEILEEKPNSAQLSKELAIEAIHNGNNAAAIRELKKAISLQPNYPDLHNYLGIAYGNSGMSDDAIQEFETSLKINPYYIKARLNLALGLYEKSQFDEAQKHLSKVLEVQPKNQLANNLLAELNAVKGR